jgi:GH35 family endo-1,4-beta-xylanase
MESVRISAMPFGDGLRLTTAVKPTHDYELRATLRIPEPLGDGDPCLLVFWARALETSDEMGEGAVSIIVEKAQEKTGGGEKFLNKKFKFGREWKEFLMPFAVKACPAGGAQVMVKFGYHPQVVEIGGLTILNYAGVKALGALPQTGNLVTYGGREASAPWRPMAAARIEKFRKGPFSVKVVDGGGRAVPGARISVSMKRHAYHFGSEVRTKYILDPGENGKAYRKVIEDNFNTATPINDLMFGPWMIGEKGSPRSDYSRSNTFLSLNWLRERGLRVRGHNLLWGPLDSRAYSPARGFDFDGGDRGAMKAMLLGHLEEKSRDTRPFVAEWDAINHPVATWGVGGRTWSDVLGFEFYVEALRRARALAPEQRLFLNEGTDFPGDNEGMRARYEQLIRDCLAAKAPLDGLGFMCHFGEASLTAMDKVEELLNRFAKFDLAMQATELDIGTGGDEAAQADYLRDFMTLFFSHPATVGIVMFGFWEGAHWYPDRALWRKNWELKPNGKAWLDLVKGAWWTRVEGATDGRGILSNRGFYGEYRVEVGWEGKTRTEVRTLSPGSGDWVISLP